MCRAMRSAQSEIGVKRILDFVRNPPRHLLPGGRFLRAQQVARVFEHHHDTRVLFERRRGDRQVQHRSLGAAFRAGRRPCPYGERA